MRLKDIRSINELVTTPVEDFHAGYGEGYLNSLIIKYKDRVIAFEINPRYHTCKVLLEGDKKYFLLNLCLRSNTVKRIYDKDLREACSDNMIITNIYEFERFKKILLVDNLKVEEPKSL